MIGLRGRGFILMVSGHMIVQVWSKGEGRYPYGVRSHDSAGLV